MVSLIFLKRSLVFPQFHCFLLLLYIVHLGKLSYVSLLFFGTLCSVGFIFPFLFCLSLLFFSQLFVIPVQTTTFPSCVSVLEMVLVTASCTMLGPPSIVLQALCLPDQSLEFIHHFHCIIIKGNDLGHTCMT